MKRFVLSTFCAAVCASCLVAVQGAAAAAEPWPSIVSGDCPAAQKIRAALDDDTILEFIETPLSQVLDFLEDQHDIPIQLDQRSLDEVGMPTNTPISRNLKGISLRSALRLLLRDLDLEYVVADEVLLITTPEGAAARAEIRIYDVSQLIGDDPDASRLAATLAIVLSPATLQMPAYPGGYSGLPGGGGMGGGGGMFSVPEMQHGVEVAAEGSEGGASGGGHGMGFGMGGGCPGGGLGGEAGPADTALRITPLKNLLIVRGTEEGHRQLSELLGALVGAIKDQASKSPPESQRPTDVGADPFAPARPGPQSARQADPFR